MPHPFSCQVPAYTWKFFFIFFCHILPTSAQLAQWFHRVFPVTFMYSKSYKHISLLLTALGETKRKLIMVSLCSHSFEQSCTLIPWQKSHVSQLIPCIMARYARNSQVTKLCAPSVWGKNCSKSVICDQSLRDFGYYTFVCSTSVNLEDTALKTECASISVYLVFLLS